jgi:acyl-coenzyme A synthetase/AMP-(fatty) acid ligase
VSYHELRRKAEHAVAYLLASGVQKGDRVALYVDKSPAIISIMLLLLKLGAICVPLRFGSSREKLGTLYEK